MYEVKFSTLSVEIELMMLKNAPFVTIVRVDSKIRLKGMETKAL